MKQYTHIGQNVYCNNELICIAVNVEEAMNIMATLQTFEDFIVKPNNQN